VVLTVGNLQPEKNHEDFLALAAHLLPHQPEACFIVVGDGPRRGSLLERAVELGVADRIRWEGRREDVGTYLAACDVFVNTSQREGCSNAILEAMAAGRPVVAYGVGGNPELIADGGSGRVVPFGRTDELSHAVGAYLQDPRLARTHGEEGARRALSEFSRAAMVRRTAALYRQFLTRRMTVER
jgi:glycosyltransferase involved in cell wall biosynthesis